MVSGQVCKRERNKRLHESKRGIPKYKKGKYVNLDKSTHDILLQHAKDLQYDSERLTTCFIVKTARIGKEWK